MGNGADDRLAARHHATAAHARGYEREACTNCGEWTLAAHATPRNGNEIGYLHCDTCGKDFAVKKPSEDPFNILSYH